MESGLISEIQHLFQKNLQIKYGIQKIKPSVKNVKTPGTLAARYKQNMENSYYTLRMFYDPQIK